MSSETWAVAAVLVVVVAAALPVGRALRRRIVRAPRRPLVQARDGLVLVDAVVLPGKTILSPFTGAPCVYWRGSLEVFEDRRLPGIPDSGSWRLIWVGSGGTPFDVDDGTATARIDATLGPVEVAFSDERLLDGRSPLPDAAFARLEEDDVDLPVGLRQRYREGRLVAGSPITVRGRVELTLDPTSTAERLHRQDPIGRAIVPHPNLQPFVEQRSQG